MKLSIYTPSSKNRYEINSKQDLTIKLASISQIEKAEIWLSVEGGASIGVFTNNDKAFLIYIPKPGEAGFSSHSPRTTSSGEMIPVFMENGQQDERDVEEMVDISLGLEALKYFFSSGEKYPKIEWLDDSRV